MNRPSFARRVRAAPALLIGFGLLLVSSSTVLAQQGAVAGTVVNAQSLQPVEGAQVFVPDLAIGVLTDADGRYRLTDVPAGQVTVRVQVLGFRATERTVTVQAGQVATADFELVISAVELEEVRVNVITGLERQKRQLGANVSDINTAEVNKGSIANVDNFLAGRATGVVLQFASGDVGASSRIRIRGSNSLSLNNEPLIFIDGIQATNTTATFNNFFLPNQSPSRLNDLNPEDIENIEVVKGPAASALYGAVGANGVILITTKRGQAGRTQWNFYAEGNVLDDNSRWPDNFAAAQRREGADPNAPMFTENGFNSADFINCPNVLGALGLCTADTFSRFNTLKDPRTSPHKRGNIQTYGGNIAGGSEQVGFFLSGEAEYTSGVIDFNEEDQVSSRLNVDAALSQDLNASLSLSYTDRETEWISDSNSIFSPLIAGLCGAAAFIPGTADNGGPNRRNFCFSRNVPDLEEASPTNEATRRFTGSASGSWRPLSWLSAQGNFGLDLVDQNTEFTAQPGLDNLTEIWIIGFRNSNQVTNQNWTANASLTAQFDLTDRIRSTTTGGGSFQEERIDGVECFGAGLLPGRESCSATTTLFSVDEDFLNIVTVGAFGQQEIAINDRLFLTGSVRIDDNSNLGDQSSVQAYPAANLSYVIGEEEWFPTGKLLSEMRIRFGYGQAGTRPGFRDAATLFSPVTVTVDGADVPGVTLNVTGNETLKPERTTEFETGFDAGLLDGRLGVEFTYFNKDSEDALISRELPPSLGLTAAFFDNIGSIRNKGVELAIRADAVQKRNFRANFLTQFTSLDNTVERLGEGIDPITFNTQRHEEGFPAGAFWQSPFTFSDANGDGLIGPEEVEVAPAAEFLDESTPTWTASLTTDLEFFQFLRFSTLVEARGGHSQQDLTERFRCLRAPSVAGTGCEASGSPDAPLFDQAALIASTFAGTDAGFIDEAAFLKWREFSATITAPPSLARKHRLLERSSVTFSGRNLALLTGYRGIDPEINSFGAGANFSQREFNTQPPLRTFTVRLDMRF